MHIRPMRVDDVGIAELVTARAFSSSVPARTPATRRRWMDRLRHIIAVDGNGCWLAENDGEVIGVAASISRDLLWVLSTYAIDPRYQGRGAGRALLDAAIGYGRGCLRGMVCGPPSPPALRRYRGAGFTLHPTMRVAGVVDHTAVPDISGVRAGTESDLDLVDSVDRQVRGASHRPDHPALGAGGPLLVCDLLTGSGYAYLDHGSVGPLAATSRSIAQRLLWAGLAQFRPGREVVVRYLTSDQQWAVDVGLAAGLRVEIEGCLGFRYMRPPAPYVPSPLFG